LIVQARPPQARIQSFSMKLLCFVHQDVSGDHKINELRQPYYLWYPNKGLPSVLSTTHYPRCMTYGPCGFRIMCNWKIGMMTSHWSPITNGKRLQYFYKIGCAGPYARQLNDVR
jgi:hypothetical protein